MIVAVWAGLAAGVAAIADEGESARLVERAEPGRRSRIVVTLEAEGHYLPGESDEANKVTPLELTVKTRLEFADRILRVGPDGRADRVVRRVQAGEAAIAGPEPIRAETTAPAPRSPGSSPSARRPRDDRRRQPRRPLEPCRAGAGPGAGRRR